MLSLRAAAAENTACVVIALQSMERHIPSAVSITVCLSAEKECASKKTSSAMPGMPAPPEPPLVADQCEVSFHAPVPPTQ